MARQVSVRASSRPPARLRRSYAGEVMAARQPLFRLLGFPVHVGAGFVIFMVLLAFINEGGEFGWWLAGSVAGFTLIHELAHAVVARRAGAEASISLEFMAGFTSYHAKKPLTRPWTLAISLAGPLTHVAAGVGAARRPGRRPVRAPVGVRQRSPRRGVVGRTGHRADQPDPRAPARRRARHDDGPRPLPAREGGDGDDLRQCRRHRRLPCWRRRSSTVWPGMTVFIGFLLLIQLQGLFAHRQRTAVSPIDAAVAAARAGDRPRAEATPHQGVRPARPARPGAEQGAQRRRIP